MDKPLHEQLPEYGWEGKDLADNILSEYIPIPRDKDGKPWLQGDEFEDCCGEVHKVDGYQFHPSEEGGCDAMLCDEGGFAYPVKDCKRPTPKVLDADGVPCKSNDEVWSTNKDGVYEDGDMMIVVGIDAGVKEKQVLVRRALGGAGEQWVTAKYLTHEKPVFDADGVRICKGDVGWSDLTGEKLSPVEGFSEDAFGTQVELSDGSWIEPLNFTHREPDSLEKLRDDMNFSARKFKEYHGHIPAEKMREYADRLTALI